MRTSYKIFTICSIIVILFVIYINVPEHRKQIKTTHFTFLFSNNTDSLNIVALSRALEENYSRIGNNLNTVPAKNIEVNIYGQRWRYIKATGHWGASGNIEGISKLHFVENTWLETEISKIAIHEFAHTVVLKLLIDKEPKPLNAEVFDEKFSAFPIWLWEGLSVYEAEQFYDPKSLSYLNKGAYPQLSELNDRSKGQKIYTCGFTIIEYILTEYGKNKLIKLIESYGDLENVLGVTERQFSKNWYEFVNNKYLK